MEAGYVIDGIGYVYELEMQAPEQAPAFRVEFVMGAIPKGTAIR